MSKESDKLKQIIFKNEHSYCDKADVDFLLNLINKQTNEICRLKCLLKENKIYRDNLFKAYEEEKNHTPL